MYYDNISDLAVDDFREDAHSFYRAQFGMLTTPTLTDDATKHIIVHHNSLHGIDALFCTATKKNMASVTRDIEETSKQVANITA
jgi:hypothetical protein